MHPSTLLNTWIQEEKDLGATQASSAVLASADSMGVPHARVVAIREVDEQKILFFTQKITQKVKQIKHQPKVALTFWFERCAREVIVEGTAQFLTQEENERYWSTYPRMSQIRFMSYSQTSGEVIPDKAMIEDKRKDLLQKYENTDEYIPTSENYIGISIVPSKFVFYSLRSDELSDVFQYVYEDNQFVKNRLSP